MPTKATRTLRQSGKNSQTTVEPPPALRPSWPTLEPLLPKVDLTVDILLEDQIIIIRKFFTSTLCSKLVSFLSSLPLTTTSATPKRGEALRVNDRIHFDDYDFAKQLWQTTGLDLLLDESDNSNSAQTKLIWGGKLRGLNPRIRIYRYKEGQYFAQHCKLIKRFLVAFLNTNPLHWALNYLHTVIFLKDCIAELSCFTFLPTS